MNYRTKRRRNKRKTKRIKGGTLQYIGHEFVGVNNTGRADAYLLNLLGAQLVNPSGFINLIAFYEYPEDDRSRFTKSFRDYYLALTRPERYAVENLINYIKKERVNDALRFIRRNPGQTPDGGHAYVYKITSMLKDFITLIDPPPEKRAYVQGTHFSADEKARLKEIYQNEFDLLLGPNIPPITWEAVPYERVAEA